MTTNNDLIFAQSTAAMLDIAERQGNADRTIRLQQATKVCQAAVDDFDKFSTIYRTTYLPAAAAAETNALRQRISAQVFQATDGLLRDLLADEQGYRVRLASAPTLNSDTTLLTVEARQHLLKLDALIRQETLLEAARCGDSVTVEAMRSCPRWFRDADGVAMATPELSAKVLELFGARTSPNIAALLAQVVDTRIALQTLIRDTRRHCEIVDDKDVIVTTMGKAV